MILFCWTIFNSPIGVKNDHSTFCLSTFLLSHSSSRSIFSFDFYYTFSPLFLLYLYTFILQFSLVLSFYFLHNFLSNFSLSPYPLYLHHHCILFSLCHSTFVISCIKLPHSVLSIHLVYLLLHLCIFHSLTSLLTLVILFLTPVSNFLFFRPTFFQISRSIFFSFPLFSICTLIDFLILLSLFFTLCFPTFHCIFLSIVPLSHFTFTFFVFSIYFLS